MNSHKINMYVGAILGSLLFFLLLNFFTNLIYIGREHSEHEPLAFAVDVEEAAEVEEAANGDDYGALVAAADPAKGEKLFAKCKACHKIADGANGLGPHLWGVVGRDIGTAAGYNYSEALTGLAGNWDLASLSSFIESPKGYAPGTKMTFAGLKDAQDRVNLIVYLNQADGTPIKLAEAAAAAATEVAAAVEAATPTATETEAAVEAATPTATETEAAVAAAAAPTGSDFAGLLETADAEAGKKTYKKCKSCHAVVEGKNGVGPSLWGVVNRDIASAEGYKYSEAMIAKPGNWTAADLFAYIEKPQRVVPGTKMTYPGLKDAQDRVNVIVYLNEVDGSPEPLQ